MTSASDPKRLTREHKGQIVTRNPQAEGYPHSHDWSLWRACRAVEGVLPATQWRGCLKHGCHVWQERVAPLG